MPEIADGTVEIKLWPGKPVTAARSRSSATIPMSVRRVPASGQWPAGAAVMHELNEEKIDIIDYSPDPATFVGHALSPAKVTSVTVWDENLRAARVVVPDYQLSLPSVGRARMPGSQPVDGLAHRHPLRHSPGLTSRSSGPDRGVRIRSLSLRFPS